MVLVLAVLLVLRGVWFLPSVSGQGPDSSLYRRVAVLEGLVAELTESVDDLTERVEALEEGQGSGTNSFDVIHLSPLAEFPASPTEGDLCITEIIDYVEGPGAPFIVVHFLWCYYGGDWRAILSYTPE